MLLLYNILSRCWSLLFSFNTAIRILVFVIDPAINLGNLFELGTNKWLAVNLNILCLLILWRGQNNKVSTFMSDIWPYIACISRNLAKMWHIGDIYSGNLKETQRRCHSKGSQRLRVSLGEHFYKEKTVNISFLKTTDWILTF